MYLLRQCLIRLREKLEFDVLCELLKPNIDSDETNSENYTKIDIIQTFNVVYFLPAFWLINRNITVVISESRTR